MKSFLAAIAMLTLFSPSLAQVRGADQLRPQTKVCVLSSEVTMYRAQFADQFLTTALLAGMSDQEAQQFTERMLETFDVILTHSAEVVEDVSQCTYPRPK